MQHILLLMVSVLDSFISLHAHLPHTLYGAILQAFNGNA